MDGILKNLTDISGEKNVTEYESMKQHTTFRIGGNARYFVTPESGEEVVALLEYLKSAKIPYYIVGNGSNILCSDEGFPGVIICFGRRFSRITAVDEICIKADAGALLSSVSSFACSRNLTGMEFASGIPGSVGGGVIMNAGAYGNEIGGVFESAECVGISEKGVKRLIITGETACFSYRDSIFKKKGLTVLSVTMKLKKAETNGEIRKKMQELTEKRKASQPLNYPSAGSTFKRPQNGYAAALIQESGLKGYGAGEACVSEKHSGFIVNRGNASCSDVFRLISEVREKVYGDSGILLEPEVCFLGKMPGSLYEPERS